MITMNYMVQKGYKKGACKNCGAMTHKEKDCLERPRSAQKTAAKLGVRHAEDDVIMKMEVAAADLVN